jgi:hypothetical protein
VIPRRHLRPLAAVLIGALLFAQAAVALAACESLSRAPARAIAQGDQPPVKERCHEQGENVNLCVAHCLAGDQSFDKPASPLAAAAPAPVLRLELAPALNRPETAQRRLPHPPAAAPPRILFVSLLI